MDKALQSRLETLAQTEIDPSDAAHDIEHARRVMGNCLAISRVEGGDPDVLVPAALFHDLVMYPKNDPRSGSAARESATRAAALLASIPDYPTGKIPLVVDAIANCSFSNECAGHSLETCILQDADRLEATGAIAVMRTFWSAGQMGQPLYHPWEPFPVARPADGLTHALDLFWTRLLQVESRMNTIHGRELANSRTKFLETFLAQLGHEIEGVVREG